MANKSRKKEIPYVVITKKPNGKKDKYGRNCWDVVGRSEGKTKPTTYKELKVDTYNKIKKNNSNSKNLKMYPKFEDVFRVKKTRRLVSVTKQFANGSKQTTYFR